VSAAEPVLSQLAHEGDHCASSPAVATTASALRLAYSVAININAPASRIWALLTDAPDFPRWNSTVSNIEGVIALGEKLQLTVPISARTFTPKVVAFVPLERMVWSDGVAPRFKGERTFTLTPNRDGTTDFSMVEVFKGLLLPLIKGSLPDLRQSFEHYAADLKREAESSLRTTTAEQWEL